MFTFHSKISLIHTLTAAITFSLLSACGGGGSDTPTPPPPVIEPPSPVTEIPINKISHATFRDQDASQGSLSGTVTIKMPEEAESDTAKANSIWLYWADEQGNKQGEPWLKTDNSAAFTINIPIGTSYPENTHGFLLYPANDIGLAAKGSLVLFDDFMSNVALSGLGGNEQQSWEYGVERPKIAIQRSSEQGGLCTFDNGLVSVINMANSRDENWENNSGNMLPNEVNDTAFPAYSFLCDEAPVHNADAIVDEKGVWTYSTVNDAMFYGTVVYDSFVKYLGEPPLADKIRLRVHYGNQQQAAAYWDGAYATFGDAYLYSYSMAPLDAIAHEVGHGVLNRISDLNLYEHDISTDARTLHEAFGDISGVMAKYEFSGHTDNWVHGEESAGLTRQLNQIITESGAIHSLFDYDKAGDNYYLRIGMITYPFYLLSNQWGLETAYEVYLTAAKTCWTAMGTLTEAAQCIKQTTRLAGLDEADVIAAFKTVKIKLFEEGVLSHYQVEQFKLRNVFTDNSQTTSQITQWHWDFGDGQTSTAQHPEHTYIAAGNYPVKLTVTDQSDDQDTFTRIIEVADQYCPIKSNDPNNYITKVSFEGVAINYNQAQWDYTQTPFHLNTPNQASLDIEGDSLATEKSTRWKVWIDLNDNGIYGDNDQELVVNEFIAEGLPYALSTQLDLSALPNDGSPKFMRIIGDYATVTPCSSNVGEALDLRVTW